MKKIEQEKNRPASNIPYQGINKPFRTLFIVPGPGVEIEQDANGVCYISAEGGAGVADLVAGDNIDLTKTDDGKVIISAVDTATEIAAGQNITIDIDPETGTAVINSITGGATNEHYQGVFDTAEDLIAYDTDPEVGDYGMVKQVTYSDGGETTWNGQYKYCFYIAGQWTVVDQMLTFTDDIDLLQQFYSVGGSSPVIYLHKIAQTGSFHDLRDVPIVATPEVTVEGTTVTATCATEGAEIWYTTDGTMPHVNGSKYTGPITVSGATTFRFVGIKNGMINSLEAVVGADYDLMPPTIDYDYHTAEVTLSNPNVDGNDSPVGDIYYTLDGSDPDSSSTLYTGPFVIQAPSPTTDRVVKAVVYDQQNDNYSEIVTETYPEAFIRMSGSSIANTGVLSDFGWVELNRNVWNPAPDGETYYTIDGSDPDYNSTPFTERIYFNRYGDPVVLKVRGYRPGYIPSKIYPFSEGYSTPTAPTIVFDADTNTVTLGTTGNVTASPAITLMTTADTPEVGCRIYYTTDGSTPTDQSTLYTGPFQISGNVTVKAVLVAYGQYYSDVTTETIEPMSAPEISFDYETGLVTLTNPNGRGNIHYTKSTETPTAESPVYNGPFQAVVNPGSNYAQVRAIVIDGSEESPVSMASIQRAPAESIFVVPTTNYTTGVVTEKLTGSIPTDATVRYSDDGQPSSESPVYNGPVTFDYFDSDNPRTVLFRMYRPGYLPSSAFGAAGSYGHKTPDAPGITYDEETGIVEMALSGNTAKIPLQTNNNTPTLGARIYYTTDGSTPTTSSTLYTRAFNLPEGATVIKAITVCYGEFESDVTTEEVSPVDYGPLCFTALKSGAILGGVCNYLEGDCSFALEYSTDGETWQAWEYEDVPVQEAISRVFDNIVFENTNDKVYIRGDNPEGTRGADYEFVFYGDPDKSDSSADFSLSGDVQYLKDKTGTDRVSGCYADLFSNFANLYISTAPVINVNEIGTASFSGMFYGQESLLLPARFPGLTLQGLPSIFDSPDPTPPFSLMYSGCTALEQSTDFSGIVVDSSTTNADKLRLLSFSGIYSDTFFDITEDNGESVSGFSGISFPFDLNFEGETQTVDEFAFGFILGNINGFDHFDVFANTSPNESGSLDFEGGAGGSGLGHSANTVWIPTGETAVTRLTCTPENGYSFVKWQQSQDGETYVDIPGETTNTLTLSSSEPGTHYYIRAILS